MTQTDAAAPIGATAKPEPISVEVYPADQANDFRARPPADATDNEWR